MNNYKFQILNILTINKTIKILHIYDNYNFIDNNLRL